MDAAAPISRETITKAAAALFSADSVKQIPERFIRTDEIHAAGAVIVGDDESFELPVVDMAKLLDPESSALEVVKLGSACRDWGFFQVRTQEIGLVYVSFIYLCRIIPIPLLLHIYEL
jgi:hypothetical protein